MSTQENPLERVIAEQQSKIDSLEKRLERNIQADYRAMQDMDSLAFDVFELCHTQPATSALANRIRMALSRIGFCPVCQVRPCNCEEDE